MKILRFETRRPAFIFLAGACLWLSACRDKQVEGFTARSLDRPTDIAMVCAHLECAASSASAKCEVVFDNPAECRVTPRRNCQATPGPGGKTASQLFAFVTSSARNEVALVSECSGEVVDTNNRLPGRNLLPVGVMPTHISASEDGCKVVTANAGSCDLSVLDSPSLVPLGFGLYPAPGGPDPKTPAGNPGSTRIDAVRTVKPQRLDGATGQWQPLGVSPAQIIAVPESLSSLATGTRQEGSAGTQGGVCQMKTNKSVYALFPSCDLLAEIDLQSGHILQSLQFFESENGEIKFIDRGQNPSCGVPDCPVGVAASKAGDNSNQGEAQLSGIGPRSMVLVQDLELRNPSQPEMSMPGAFAGALYVGGLGSAHLFEVRIAANTRKFDLNTRSVALAEGSGIAKVRVSPQFFPNRFDQGQPLQCVALDDDSNANGSTRFAYVVAGDASTRVVQLSAHADAPSVGRECDTQLDPVEVSPDGPDACLCHPVEAKPTRRRAGAQGPGIRLQDPQRRIVDWAFVPSGSGQEEGFLRIEADAENPNAGQYVFPSMMAAIGVTSDGQYVISNFGQYQRRRAFATQSVGSTAYADPKLWWRDTPGMGDKMSMGGIEAVIDRYSTLRLGLGPHSLYGRQSLEPIRIGGEGIVEGRALPLLVDAEPIRVVPGRADAIAALAPGLRRIDKAYAYSAPGSSGGGVADSAGAPLHPFLLGKDGRTQRIMDGLGKNGRNHWGLYDKDVARVVTRDYRSWPEVKWELAWEGAIWGTASTAGRLQCRGNTTPGGAECLESDPARMQLVNERVDFCKQGVLPGDQVVIFGCRKDGDCGSGQKCLQRSENANERPGICISALEYDRQSRALREACAHFLSDPCGDATLAYEIKRATTNTLDLAVMPLRVRSHWATADNCPRGGHNNHLEAGVCVCDPGYVQCGEPLLSDAEGRPLAIDCARGQDPAVACKAGQVPVEENFGHELRDRFVCLQEQPEGGCRNDSDCDDLRLPPEQLAQLSAAGQRAALRICLEGRCRRPCLAEKDIQGLPEQDRRIIAAAPGVDPKNPPSFTAEDCLVRRGPGPLCFAELQRYEVRARNAFVLRASDRSEYNYFAQGVRKDPQTGECVEDPAGETSPLLRSRFPLGADLNEVKAAYPECPDQQTPGLKMPNPCLEKHLRDESASDPSLNRFHRFAYRNPNQVVDSLRIANPVLAFNLDLSDLSGLIAKIPGQSANWPASMAAFSRSRIPDGFRWHIQSGRNGYNVAETLGRIRARGRGGRYLLFPTQLVQQPGAPGIVYTVDSAGSSSPGGGRGQVLRGLVSGGEEGRVILMDPSFDSVR